MLFSEVRFLEQNRSELEDSTPKEVYRGGSKLAGVPKNEAPSVMSLRFDVSPKIFILHMIERIDIFTE